jgi:CHAP domain-containing protein
MLLREKLVEAEVAAAALGIHEVGGNNQGPWVKKFLAEVGLPEGYAWCDAFQSYEEHGVAGRRLPIESASVGQTYATAKQLGWVVTPPARGDLVCYDFDGDGQCDDHIGIVVKVLSLGPVLTLQTVEGNTSSGVAGSQADGDGVYLRRRVVSAKAVAFVRIPGRAPDSPIQGESNNDVPHTAPVASS